MSFHSDGTHKACCCHTCDARMIELVQAIDDLRRSLVIVLQDMAQNPERFSGDHVGGDSYYWNHG